MNTKKITVFWVAVAVVGIWVPMALAGGTISGGFYDLGAGVSPRDVSTDGTLVGGEAGSDNAFVWTQAGGRVDVGGDFRGIDWYADDGHYSGVTTNTIIMAGRDSDNHARVWFGNADGSGSGWFRLPLTGSAEIWKANGTALGVAPDSSNYWVCGYYRSGNSQRAVRYKHSSLSATPYGRPSGGEKNHQFDGSSNEGHFAGRCRYLWANSARRGIYQTSWLARAGGEGEANNISADGTVAVGWDNNKPVWWGPLPGSTSRHEIPLPAGDSYGEATCCNADGSIIVGWSYNYSVRQNWIWDSVNGTREIGAFLASQGATVPAGFNFDASGNDEIMISGGGYDNLTIAGNGDRATTRGYVVHIPIPLEVDIDILPGDDPNLLTQNVNNKGRLPIAILSSEDYDINEIDVNSISIAGVVLPVKEPKATGDHLMVHVSRRDLILALGLDTLEPGTVVPITVDGVLLGGRPLFGTDNVTMVARVE